MRISWGIAASAILSSVFANPVEKLQESSISKNGGVGVIYKEGLPPVKKHFSSRELINRAEQGLLTPNHPNYECSTEPAPALFLCDMNGNSAFLSKPSVLSLTSDNSLNGCRDACIFEEKCLSFGFDWASNACTLLSQALTTMGIYTSRSSTHTYFDRHCFICKEVTPTEFMTPTPYPLTTYVTPTPTPTLYQIPKSQSYSYSYSWSWSWSWNPFPAYSTSASTPHTVSHHTTVPSHETTEHHTTTHHKTSKHHKTKHATHSTTTSSSRSHSTSTQLSTSKSKPHKTKKHSTSLHSHSSSSTSKATTSTHKPISKHTKTHHSSKSKTSKIHRSKTSKHTTSVATPTTKHKKSHHSTSSKITKTLRSKTSKHTTSLETSTSKHTKSHHTSSSKTAKTRRPNTSKHTTSLPTPKTKHTKSHHTSSSKSTESHRPKTSKHTSSLETSTSKHTKSHHTSSSTSTKSHRPKTSKRTTGVHNPTSKHTKSHHTSSTKATTTRQPQIPKYTTSPHTSTSEHTKSHHTSNTQAKTTQRPQTYEHTTDRHTFISKHSENHNTKEPQEKISQTESTPSTTPCSSSSTSKAPSLYKTSNTPPLSTPSQVACGNQGLQWAYYNNTSGDNHDFSYSTFDPTAYKGVTPVYSDVTSSVGSININGDSVLLSTIYGSTQNFRTTHFVLNHRGYIFIPKSGNYKVVLSDADDIAMVWFGAPAYSGWTSSNANIDETYTEIRRLNSTGGTYSSYLAGGQYVPIRIMYANGQGPARFRMTIYKPDGSVLLDSDTDKSPYVLQHSCDGLTAPEFPMWGHEL